MPTLFTALFALFRSPFAKWLGLALALAAGAWSAYLAIDSRATTRCETEHRLELAEHIERAQAQAHQIAMQDAEISQYYEVWRTRTVTKTEEVIREIPAECARCAISARGMQLLNAARSEPHQPAPDTRQPDNALPPAAAPGAGDSAGIGVPLTDRRADVLRLRDETQTADAGGEIAGGI